MTTVLKHIRGIPNSVLELRGGSTRCGLKLSAEWGQDFKARKEMRLGKWITYEARCWSCQEAIQLKWCQLSPLGWRGLNMGFLPYPAALLGSVFTDHRAGACRLS